MRQVACSPPPCPRRGQHHPLPRFLFHHIFLLAKRQVAPSGFESGLPPFWLPSASGDGPSTVTCVGGGRVSCLPAKFENCPTRGGMCSDRTAPVRMVRGPHAESVWQRLAKPDSSPARLKHRVSLAKSVRRRALRCRFARAATTTTKNLHPRSTGVGSGKGIRSISQFKGPLRHAYHNRAFWLADDARRLRMTNNQPARRSSLSLCPSSREAEPPEPLPPSSNPSSIDDTTPPNTFPSSLRPPRRCRYISPSSSVHTLSILPTSFLLLLPPPMPRAKHCRVVFHNTVAPAPAPAAGGRLERCNPSVGLALFPQK